MNHSQRLARAQMENFGHVLLACARRLDELAQARVNARRAGPPLARPSVMRLVPFLDDQVGVRPADLARRLDVSKQAINQSLAPLLAAGLVKLEADPSDGRALLAKLTPAGATAFQLGLDTLASFEAPLAARMTSPSLETTFRGLRQILALLHDPALEPSPQVSGRKPASTRSARSRS